MNTTTPIRVKPLGFTVVLSAVLAAVPGVLTGRVSQQIAGRDDQNMEVDIPERLNQVRQAKRKGMSI